MENKEIKLGKYKHFKGHDCKVVGVAKYSEDEKQEFVVYEHTYEDGRIQLWVRPKKMFLEEVEINGKKVPRFEYIGE
ncbi:MAG: DUF1653 domain-containing protein [Candidatus Parcubacteria bacterium]|nr:DUF1653 domain-containing protein [Candidatus Parcubacteria bacterium]